MQETKITFKVQVTYDESRVIITELAMTQPISFGVAAGIFRSLADFEEEWNKEHKQKGICQNTNG